MHAVRRRHSLATASGVLGATIAPPTARTAEPRIGRGAPRTEYLTAIIEGRTEDANQLVLRSDGTMLAATGCPTDNVIDNTPPGYQQRAGRRHGWCYDGGTERSRRRCFRARATSGWTRTGT